MWLAWRCHYPLQRKANSLLSRCFALIRAFASLAQMIRKCSQQSRKDTYGSQGFFQDEDMYAVPVSVRLHAVTRAEGYTSSRRPESQMLVQTCCSFSIPMPLRTSRHCQRCKAGDNHVDHCEIQYECPTCDESVFQWLHNVRRTLARSNAEETKVENALGDCDSYPHTSARHCGCRAIRCLWSTFDHIGIGMQVTGAMVTSKALFNPEQRMSYDEFSL